MQANINRIANQQVFPSSTNPSGITYRLWLIGQFASRQRGDSPDVVATDIIAMADAVIAKLAETTPVVSNAQETTLGPSEYLDLDALEASSAARQEFIVARVDNGGRTIDYVDSFDTRNGKTEYITDRNQACIFRGPEWRAVWTRPGFCTIDCN